MPGVPRQGELAHSQDAAAYIAYGQVGYAVLIIEYPEAHALVGDIPGILLRIPHLHADEDHEAPFDGRGEFPADGNGGTKHSLYDGSHIFTSR